MLSPIVYLLKHYFSKDHSKKTFKQLSAVIEVVVGSVLMVLLWYFGAWEYFRVCSEDTELISMVSAGVMVFSSILPIMTVYRVGIQYDAIQVAAILWELSPKDSPEREKYFNDLVANYVPHIEFGTHFFLIVTSCAAIVSSMLPPYKHFTTGFFFVFVITFFHYFCLVAAVRLDNPNLKEMGVCDALIKEMVEKGIKINGNLQNHVPNKC